VSGNPLDPNDPLGQFAAGLAKGTLQWTADKISEFLRLISEKQLAFVGNPDLISEVKEHRARPEYQFYVEYLKDRRLKLLALMGLTLRDYQSDPLRHDDLQLLRNRIKTKYDEAGLHVAQIVQSGILAELIPPVISSPGDKASAARKIEAFLNDSERLCLFIQDRDQIDHRVTSIQAYLAGSKPPLFVLFARGKAKATLSEIVHILKQRSIPYGFIAKDLDRSLLVIFITNTIPIGV
jgi:hypothetical protein